MQVAVAELVRRELLLLEKMEEEAEAEVPQLQVTH
jgi:hypothetical protein